MSDGDALDREVVVYAGGGVVWRSAADGPELLLVHRPRYDDWTFPKGKLDDGETMLECALREVEEETGYRCVAGEELAACRYLDGKGRSKLVRYWLMEVSTGEFEPNDEVDELRWLPLDRAGHLLSYGRDLAVLASAELSLT